MLHITVFHLHFTVHNKYTLYKYILYIYCNFSRYCGRGPLFTPQQEEAICTMVKANNAIRLREIESAILEDNNVFENIQSISISTIDRVLKRHQMSMKELYQVPFERNGDRVKELSTPSTGISSLMMTGV